MNNVNNKAVRYAGVEQNYDYGLRAYLVGVFRYMALALLITALTAYMVASSPQAISAIFGTPLGLIVIFAPLGIAMFMGFRIMTMSFEMAQGLFWLYSALMGMSLSVLFLAYTAESITRVFLITAAVFGSMSIYGQTTKRDLTEFGSFLIMGLWGVLIASLVNVFMQSTGLQFLLSVAGVIVFTGLTAYDTQRIKEMYYQVGGQSDVAAKISIFGALMLYMDFINLFVSLLRLFGERRD
ncbi:MAG: Bax inhibitor-1/YccA family protein [Proteobacteria bacterium]|nr:Bax inhibitor-1/YccA family protein [Pseudomonadota bacterium]